MPSNQEEWKGLVNKIMALGLTSKEANSNLEKRRKMYNMAMKEYSNSGMTTGKKGRPKFRKNSLNDL